MSAIRLNGTSSGYTELAPPAAAGSNTITLPSSNGSANQFLKNGSTAGTLGWSSMVEDSSGNIGVGASSPDAKLKVHGASGTNVFAAQSTGGNGVLVAPYDNNPIYHLAYAANSTAYAIGSQSNIPTLLFTGNAERARITSAGEFCFATTGTVTSVAGGIAMSTYGGGSFLDVGHTTGASSGDAFVSFRRAGTSIGSITQSGTTAVAYNTSSDYRLKENVVPLTGAADRLVQLPVHRFNFISDPDRTVDGFLAHEAQAVVPECVTGEKDAVDEDGNPIYQGIDQSKLVPLLTAALQEALDKIASLEARITALEAA